MGPTSELEACETFYSYVTRFRLLTFVVSRTQFKDVSSVRIRCVFSTRQLSWHLTLSQSIDTFSASTWNISEIFSRLGFWHINSLLVSISAACCFRRLDSDSVSWSS